MADDTSQDQTQATTRPTQQATDQPPVEAPPVQQPSVEQPATPVPSEAPTTPTPPTSPSPGPTAPASSEPQPETTPTESKTETPAPVETPSQPEQTQPATPPAETQSTVSPPVINIPALHYPFSGNFSVTFAFGAQPTNEEIKKKFSEWGIVGHNGLDFGLTSGTEVFPCDVGKVIQSGDNGDFGVSITIQHSWGQSLYAHLSETKVKVDDEIQPNKIIGLSGSSGAAFGEHLHFAIKPNNPDSNNGYLGFIDPAPYLSLPSQKEETKQELPTPPIEEPKPQETPLPESSQSPQQAQQPPVEEVPPPIKLEPEKLTEQPQQPENPLPVEADAKAGQNPQLSPEDIQKQVDEKLKVELDLRRQKANEARIKKKEENLTKIFNLVQSKRVVTNDEVRDLLHVSQSTATNYLTEMVNRGMLKKEGERGGAKYSI